MTATTPGNPSLGQGDDVERSLSDALAPRLRLSERLLSLVRGRAPIRLGVVHPCTADVLEAVLAATREQLVVATLIGPARKIGTAAEQAKVALSDFAMVDVPHSHAAAARAVAMARAGELDALLKGSLHTDELMEEVVRENAGLRTERRMSHVFVLDVPRYAKLLMLTDAAINIEPTLEDKVDIVRNAIDLAHALGIALPKVAILSAIETVTPKLKATIDAAALCKMADRGQISGALIDGPLAFDNAVSMKAAKVKEIRSQVAGQADILVVPDLEAGNMLAKQLEYFADAEAAGIVLGARVPIALTSRADDVHARVASCALASLLRRRHVGS
jgi:phosphotransacetylase